jgi:hypothetical protein
MKKAALGQQARPLCIRSTCDHGHCGYCTPWADTGWAGTPGERVTTPGWQHVGGQIGTHGTQAAAGAHAGAGWRLHQRSHQWQQPLPPRSANTARITTTRIARMLASPFMRRIEPVCDGRRDSVSGSRDQAQFFKGDGESQPMARTDHVRLFTPDSALSIASCNSASVAHQSRCRACPEFPPA